MTCRLAAILDPAQHYAQQKQVSVLSPGNSLVIQDILSSKFETYDSLSRVYNLYSTLSKNSNLAKFRFLNDWPTLSDADKRAKYSEFACHELHFFLYKKDRQFFDTVVRPYLIHKKDKTFMDDWLLQRPLNTYLSPWRYQQLNLVERILLAQSIKAERKATQRHIAELFEMLPPNIERDMLLFDTAIAGQALSTKDRFGVAGKRAELQEESLSKLSAVTDRVANMSRARTSSKKMAKPQAAPQAGARRGGRGYFAEKNMDKARKSLRQLYRPLDSTKEWVENNYYHLPIEQQNGGLVKVSRFWNQYAAVAPDAPFYSEAFAEASSNLTEMIMALSALDLPFKSKEHKSNIEGNRLTLTAASPLIVVHQEVKPATRAEGKVLVSQSFFRRDDRYRQVNNERVDKFVSEEFLTHVVYGCQVIVTNPTSSRHKLDILLQIPQGAIPCWERNQPETCESNSTLTGPMLWSTISTSLTPAIHTLPRARCSRREDVAFEQPFKFNVLNQLTKVDTESWAYVSQFGSNEQVTNYLETHNLGRINLAKIAFRMRDKAFYTSTLALLTKRHRYDATLWSYSVHHQDGPRIAQYLEHHPSFLAQCGTYLDSSLVKIDPVLRRTYQHMEYRPLVNARAHQLGTKRQILNDRFYAQYHRMMKMLTYKRTLKNDDLMAVTYYYLLQDRVAEAIETFAVLSAML